MTTPNNAAALERCPFCGAEPMDHAIEPHTHSPFLKQLGIPDHGGSHVVECGCGAGLIDDTKEAVFTRWNRRATLAQPDALTSQPSGEAVSIPVVQQTAPERIWLAVADDAYYADKPFPDGEEVCWSSDAPLQVCVPYVRVDLATHPSADAPGQTSWEVEIERLREWRLDVCERLGMSCAAGAEWTPSDVYRHVCHLETMAADAPGVAVDWLSTGDFMKAVSIELMLTFADDSASAVKAYMAISKVTAALAPKPEGGHD